MAISVWGPGPSPYKPHTHSHRAFTIVGQLCQLFSSLRFACFKDLTDSYVILCVLCTVSKVNLHPWENLTSLVWFDIFCQDWKQTVPLKSDYLFIWTSLKVQYQPTQMFDVWQREQWKWLQLLLAFKMRSTWCLRKLKDWQWNQKQTRK